LPIPTRSRAVEAVGSPLSQLSRLEYFTGESSVLGGEFIDKIFVEKARRDTDEFVAAERHQTKVTDRAPAKAAEQKEREESRNDESQ